MPAAPRQKGKAKKIAYAVLGVPANMRSKKTAEQKRRDTQMRLEDTMRAR